MFGSVRLCSAQGRGARPGPRGRPKYIERRVEGRVEGFAAGCSLAIPVGDSVQRAVCLRSRLSSTGVRGACRGTGLVCPMALFLQSLLPDSMQYSAFESAVAHCCGRTRKGSVRTLLKLPRQATEKAELQGRRLGADAAAPWRLDPHYFSRT